MQINGLRQEGSTIKNKSTSYKNRIENSIDLFNQKHNIRAKARSSNEASIYYIHNISDFNKENLLSYNTIDYTVFVRSTQKQAIGVVNVFEGTMKNKMLLKMSSDELINFNSHFLHVFFTFFDFI